MTKRAKRWKVSDIVAASVSKWSADRVTIEARWLRLCGKGDDAVLAELLEGFGVTMASACDTEECEWGRMTHEQRCDALVATAKRLNVPRRA